MIEFYRPEKKKEKKIKQTTNNNKKPEELFLGRSNRFFKITLIKHTRKEAGGNKLNQSEKEGYACMSACGEDILVLER